MTWQAALVTFFCALGISCCIVWVGMHPMTWQKYLVAIAVTGLLLGLWIILIDKRRLG